MNVYPIRPTNLERGRGAVEREQPKPDINDDTVVLVACGIAYALFTRGIRKTTSAIWSDMEVARQFLAGVAQKRTRLAGERLTRAAAQKKDG